MYYNLEKAAEILSMTPGDLNRLREAGKMRAFRDGNDWKFRKEDIDNYLAEKIKNRSKAAIADDADDLLNETEEELPTMLADSTSFESLVSASPEAVKINTHDPADDGILLDNTQEPDVVALDETPDAGIKIDGGSSGISLIGDEDSIQTAESGSGISLLDDGLFELGGSNVDLGQEDIILGDGSGSGLNLTGGSGITLGSLSSDGSGSGISLLSDDNLFSLAPGPASGEGVESKPAPSAAKAEPAQSEESEIFALAEDPNKLVQVNGTEDVTILQASGDEDFQLAPIATGDEDSDSESSSQVIPLEDENIFMTEDSDADQVYGLAGEEAKRAEETPAAPSAPAAPVAVADDDLGLDLNAGFGDMGNDFDSLETGGDLGGDLGGGFELPDSGALPPVSDSGAAPDFTPSGAEPFGTLGSDPGPMPETFGAAPLPIAGGCSYAAGKGCRQDPGYSGLSIGLGLVPCIALLILCGIAAYELIRTIWSWDQPFGLTGTLLETIGGLIDLT